MNENNVVETAEGEFTGTFTFSLPGGGVAKAEAGSTMEEFLEERGVDPDSVTLMVNGEATTLSAVIADGDVVIAGRDGKGA